MNRVIKIAIAVMLFITIILFSQLLELVVQEYDNFDTLYIGLTFGMVYTRVIDEVSKKIEEEDK